MARHQVVAVESKGTDKVDHQYSLSKDELCRVVKAYLQRTHHEDVDIIRNWNGIEGLVSSLQTNVKSGLSDSEQRTSFEARKAAFGENRVPTPEPKPFLQLCWEAWDDFTLRVLSVSSIISLVIGVTVEGDPSIGWIEGFAIFMAVLIVVLVTAGNDYQKERQFRSLNAVRSNRDISVLRNDTKVQVSVFDLQVGDICLVETGDDVPADAVLLDGFNIKMDESAMTGETDLISKSSYEQACQKSAELLGETGGVGAEGKSHHAVPSPVMISGTKVMEGTGKMMLIAVGQSSEVGRAMALIQQDAEATPLQRKLEKIAQDIGKAGLFIAVVTLLVLYLRFLIEMFGTKRFSWNQNVHPGELVHYFIVSVTVVVVAIPEGLPLAVTISLAYSVKRMLKDKNLVRRLQACETMGGANTICSDKTGTLTTNRMTVRQFWKSSTYNTEKWDKSILSYEKDEPSDAEFSNNNLAVLGQCVAVNSTAFLQITPHPEGEVIHHVGSKTECALIQYTRSLGQNYEVIREQRPVYRTYPFSSFRKRMSTVVKDNTTNGYRLFTKGASEIVLGLCSHVLCENGSIAPLTEEVKKRIVTEVINNFAGKALRTICVAYRDLDDQTDFDAVDGTGQPLAEHNLVCIGIAGIQDPVRREVPDAVRACQIAGITVRMVTGDNIITAKAIARQCGIYNPEDGGIAMEGPEFCRRVGGLVCSSCRTETCDCARDSITAKKLKKPLRVDTIKDAAEFDKLWYKLEVMARSRPEDKYALVTGLIERGQVVAVTGDGTNDAPALKKADVGFAMGMTGTEVAKEASDIILMDDNFKSIVSAVKWGRNVYDNIRRFLQFQITVNIVAVFSAFIGAIVIKESPLSAVQLLWVNLIMDTFASLALATEPPTDALLNRPPHSRSEYILSQVMWRNVLGQAVYQLIIVFGMTFAGEYMLPEYGSGKTIFYNEGTSFVAPGRLYDYDGSEAWHLDKDFGPSRHFTYVFNTFVMMQLFNEINSRKLHNEWNVLTGVLNNHLFVGIWLLTFGLQILMVQFGSLALSCHYEGLTWQQWLICLALGAGSLLVSLFLHLVPISLFPASGKAEQDPLRSSHGVLSVRRVHSARSRHSSNKIVPYEEYVDRRKSVHIQPLGV